MKCKISPKQTIENIINAKIETNVRSEKNEKCLKIDNDILCKNNLAETDNRMKILK